MESSPLSKEKLRQLLLDACSTDDVPLVTKCISMARRTDSQVTVQEALQVALNHILAERATKCFFHVLEQGVDVKNLDSYDIVDSVASVRETAEILISHGWDINSERDGLTLLWHAVGDHELVQWCLDQGANVNPPDPAPRGACRREPILERAAESGNIATFELLRSKGAPLDREFGVFPVAVMIANDYVRETTEYNPRLQQQITMLKHLLEVVGCDVNSDSYGPHYRSGSMCSTPLCWIACHPKGPNAKELIWFLLDHGGDPDLKLELTDGNGEAIVVQSARKGAVKNRWGWRYNQHSVDAVEEWELQDRGGSFKEE